MSLYLKNQGTGMVGKQQVSATHPSQDWGTKGKEQNSAQNKPFVLRLDKYDIKINITRTARMSPSLPW